MTRLYWQENSPNSLINLDESVSCVFQINQQKTAQIKYVKPFFIILFFHKLHFTNMIYIVYDIFCFLFYLASLAKSLPICQILKKP